MSSNWVLQKRFTFEASHQLPHHDGKCRRLHGHSWVAVVEISGDRLNEVPGGAKHGMLVDYGDLTQMVQPIVDQYLDHWHLNETTGLEGPTSELLAQWLYWMVKPRLPKCVRLQSVTIEETCSAACTYSED